MTWLIFNVSVRASVICATIGVGALSRFFSCAFTVSHRSSFYCAASCAAAPIEIISIFFSSGLIPHFRTAKIHFSNYSSDKFECCSYVWEFDIGRVLLIALLCFVIQTRNDLLKHLCSHIFLKWPTTKEDIISYSFFELNFWFLMNLILNWLWFRNR